MHTLLFHSKHAAMAVNSRLTWLGMMDVRDIAVDLGRVADRGTVVVRDAVVDRGTVAVRDAVVDQSEDRVDKVVVQHFEQAVDMSKGAVRLLTSLKLLCSASSDKVAVLQ